MKALLALVGLATIFFLSGCACDHAEATTKTASQPPPAPVATVTVNSTGTPLYYQWQFNGTNAKTSEPAFVGYTVVLTVNSNGAAPLAYQWYHGTNLGTVADTNVTILQLNLGTNAGGATNH
jgi:hypothetical protein